MTDEKILSVESQAKSSTGRIIGGGSGRIISAASNQGAHDDIPFVPAFDLLERAEAEKALPEEEVVAIAAALWHVATVEHETLSLWASHARVTGLSQRLNS